MSSTTVGGIAGSRWATHLAISLSIGAVALFIFQEMGIWSRAGAVSLALAALRSSGAGNAVVAAQGVDIGWYPPARTDLNNLTAVLAGSGVYGFIYDTSETPDGEYGTYNWCNMPHVRKKEYVRAPPEFELQYVELVCLCLIPLQVDT
jgi:hypothetical protein